jgi:hypothetical protein
MTRDDQNDYEAFLEGVTFFMKLDFEDTKKHLEAHPEDGFSMIRHPSGQGSALCTNAGWDQMRSLVGRRLASLPDGKDLDLEEVLQQIGQHIAPSLREGLNKGSSEQDIFERVFESALKNVADGTEEQIYHFPCVLAGAKSPTQFTVGPVRFAIASVFEEYRLTPRPGAWKPRAGVCAHSSRSSPRWTLVFRSC